MSSGRLQDTQSNTLTPADNQSALYIISIFPRPTQTTQLSGGGLETRAKSEHNFRFLIGFHGELLTGDVLSDLNSAVL